MRLSPGECLGPYEIISLIDVGGMGEVYKARDNRVDRVVALKVSKAEFSERFEREARSVASLNHPNICTLYDVGPGYLVMEYLEGRPLKGPLALEKTLAYSAQICDALDAAHRRGIIHRDLKPSNIFVGRQGIKVLDFGLASMTGDESLTQEGAILGTPAYMSPEQWQGKKADARSDIYSLGCVIHEMATGERIPCRTLSPPTLDRVVKGCIAADPEERWQSVREVRLLLEAATTQPLSSKRPVTWKWAGIAVIILIAWIAIKSFDFQQAPPQIGAHRLSILPPEGTSFSDSGFAISPNGRRLVFAGGIKDTLWIREMDSLTSHELPGTEGASFPFWSPDSKSIGFFAAGKVLRLDIGGAAPTPLCEEGNARGGTWDSNGMIVFAPPGLGLRQVSSQGGRPEPITTLLSERGETMHRWPQFLPDGKHLLVWIQSANPDHSGVFVIPIQQKNQRIRLTASSSRAQFVPATGGRPPTLLWVQGETLVAQTLDTHKWRLTGDATIIAPIRGSITATGFAHFSASRNGVLVYGSSLTPMREVQWWSRDGALLSTEPIKGYLRMVRLSPDGARLAVARADESLRVQLWIFDITRRSMMRATLDPLGGSNPVWSSDGRSLVFSAQRPGAANIFRLKSSGVEERLLASPQLQFAYDISNDGRHLVFSQVDPETANDLWILPLDGSNKPQPLLVTRYQEMFAQFSPDSRWFVHSSNETGRNEIYVRPFPGPGPKIQISTEGGHEARWSRDGRELFYISSDRRMKSVAVRQSGNSLEFSRPGELFAIPFRLDSFFYNYDVAADGKRFVMLVPTQESAPSPLTALLHW